ncbi:hypothetical protein HanXRQr2_Chr09g0388251 [Helianthus annuus]|uniref:Uncharacterized protein n=1 Tax=Helianthus annuus TaxID=4232 RepID=A0A9K3I5L8_HELAN|nr:hypothetical protein HanXRQr2_Chr09g0388251 [Helianthus annuus]KAJ0893140.1 hypothetical protein HanPSC8_Chr09g0374221 [Helianthus annuus]
MSETVLVSCILTGSLHKLLDASTTLAISVPLSDSLTSVVIFWVSFSRFTETSFPHCCW